MFYIILVSQMFNTWNCNKYNIHTVVYVTSVQLHRTVEQRFFCTCWLNAVYLIDIYLSEAWHFIAYSPMISFCSISFIYFIQFFLCVTFFCLCNNEIKQKTKVSFSVFSVSKTMWSSCFVKSGFVSKFHEIFVLFECEYNTLKCLCHSNTFSNTEQII